MMPTWAWVLIALWIGAAAGFFLASVCHVADRADRMAGLK